jgi:hypothetical protein
MTESGTRPSEAVYRGQLSAENLCDLLMDSIVEKTRITLSKPLFRDAFASVLHGIESRGGDRQLVQDICRHGKFELLKEYVTVLSLRDSSLIRLLLAGLQDDTNLHTYFLQRFARTGASVDQKFKLSFSSELSDVFANCDPGNLTAYTASIDVRPVLAAMSEYIGGRFGAFLEEQHDLLGLNSLVRRGLIKVVWMPGGSRMISKANNPHKPGRFQKEQSNLKAIGERLGLPNNHSRLEIPGSGIVVRLIRPEVVFSDGGNQKMYAWSPYVQAPTLEMVLLKENDPQVRRSYLVDVRTILDMLYASGIVWGDMAPRNIIVRGSPESREYFLFDFEKTELLNGEVPLDQRRMHCRGSMCIEEFGAVCSRSEVESCFAGYFDPARWQLVGHEEPGSLGFKCKPDYIEILRRRNIVNPTMAQYNSLELEVMDIRFPLQSPIDGSIKHPLYTGFKIDHYLGFRHDLLLTETLLRASRRNAVFNTLEAVESRIVHFETCLLINEVLGVGADTLDIERKALENFIEELNAKSSADSAIA